MRLYLADHLQTERVQVFVHFSLDLRNFVDVLDGKLTHDPVARQITELFEANALLYEPAGRRRLDLVLVCSVGEGWLKRGYHLA